MSHAVQPRSCLYGDGLFETMVFRAGRLCWWSHHWLRLQMGLKRLGYPVLDEQRVWQSLTPVLTTLAPWSIFQYCAIG